MLTIDNMDWTKFGSRTRKLDNGGYSYDRLLIGLRISSRGWLADLFAGAKDDDVAQVFILGVGNVVFAHAKGGDTLFVNDKAGAQARVYAEWYAAQGGLTIEFTDKLPTAVHTRASGGRKVDSFESACAAACEFTPTKELGI